MWKYYVKSIQGIVTERAYNRKKPGNYYQVRKLGEITEF